MNQQEFIQKVFSMCQHQIQTKNPYTGELIMVPCGTCPACRFNKSILSQNKVHAQSLVSRYVYFITLTYAQRYIPYYEYEIEALDADLLAITAHCRNRNPMYRTYTYRGAKHKLRVRGLASPKVKTFSFSVNRDYWTSYVQKADLSHNGKYPGFLGRIPYLLHDDVSLYMKRVRKYISKLGINETVHTYIVGEYGPVSFRPHFHLLLFFDSDELAQNIVRITRSCWRFGRVDCSASRGNAEDYASSYLNSFSSVPLHIQEIRAIRPFARFSNKFGYAFFEPSIKKAQSGNFDELLNGKSLPYNGFNTTVFPWRAIIDTCFYRPALRRHSDIHELTEILRYARNFKQRPALQKATLFQSPGIMYAYLQFLGPSAAARFVESDYPLHRILSFLKLDYTKIIQGEPSEVRSFHSRLYTFLRQSELFLNGIGYTLLSTRVEYLLIKKSLENSINFYNERERKSIQDLFHDSETFESDWSDIFWDRRQEKVRRFVDSDYGNLCRDKLHSEIRKRIKHREINDAVGIFTKQSYRDHGEI